MKNNKKKYFAILAMFATLAASLTACGQVDETTTITSTQKENQNTEVITIAYATSAYPAAYQEDDGNHTGYSVEIMKLVDEALPDYQFQYEIVDGDGVMVGLSSGQYQVAIGSYVSTPERKENYILPDNYLGIQVFGIVVPNENKEIRTLSDAATAGLSYPPSKPSDARYSIIEQYNEQNPDNQINLEATDQGLQQADQYRAVADGQYGFVIGPFNTYKALILDEGGELHDELADKLVINLFTGVPHYTLISKEYSELADEINEQLGILRENGKLDELSNQFYGFNQSDYYSDQLSEVSAK